MSTTLDPEARNAWRLPTPGSTSWPRSVAPGAPGKYFMVSSDCHAFEPASYLADHIEPEYVARIPRVERRDDGSEWLITEGNRPQRVKGPQGTGVDLGGSAGSMGVSGASPMETEDHRRNAAGKTVGERLADQNADGVDIELIFPNKGLLCWATPDPVFAMAMCRAWNRWAFETYGGEGWHGGRCRPLASIAAGDLAGAAAEI